MTKCYLVSEGAVCILRLLGEDGSWSRLRHSSISKLQTVRAAC